MDAHALGCDLTDFGGPGYLLDTPLVRSNIGCYFPSPEQTNTRSLASVVGNQGVLLANPLLGESTANRLERILIR